MSREHASEACLHSVSKRNIGLIGGNLSTLT